MSYININEYDYTITGPKSLDNTHIVAVPINATDGPSDRWVTVYPYDTFVQIFGPNPDPSGMFGNSWEYAANLLLRGMPVCVRRITHVLDDDGNNSTELLPGVNIAKTILKIKNITSSTDNIIGAMMNEYIDVLDPNQHSVLKSTNKGEYIRNPLYLIPSEEYDSKYPLNKDIYENHLSLEADYNNMIGENGTVSSYYKILHEKYPTLNEKYKNLIVGESFADVKGISTTTEYVYVGDKQNPNYRISSSGMTKDDVLSLNDSGSIGEFYKTVGDEDNEKGYYLEYSPTAIRNTHCRTENGSILYPDELRKIVNPVEDDFAYVTYNNVNTTEIKKVWTYSPNETTPVKNHLYVSNRNNAFKNLEALKSYTVNNTILENSWAETDAERSRYVYKYNGVGKLEWMKANSDNSIHTIYSCYEYELSDDEEVETFYNPTDKDACPSDIYTIFEHMFNNNGYYVIRKDNQLYTWIDDGSKGSWKLQGDRNDNYYYEYDINWKQTDSDWKTGLFRESFNWKVVEITDENEEELEYNHPLIIHFEDSGRPMNSTPHQLLMVDNVEINHIVINTNCNAVSTIIRPIVNDYNDIIVGEDRSGTRNTSGTFSMTNIYNQAINIYGFNIVETTDTGDTKVSYDMKLEAITNYNGVINYDPNLKIYTAENIEIVTPEIDYDVISKRFYLSLPAGATIIYNKSLSNARLSVDVAGFENFEVQFDILKSSAGKYTLVFSSEYDIILDVDKYYLNADYTDTDELEFFNEDPEKSPIIDGYGNYNLFSIQYLYPGTNGNNLNARIKTIQNQGIYIYVYRNKQFLEKIELCSFRTISQNGYQSLLDYDVNKVDIWRLLLLKFGILLTTTSTGEFSIVYPQGMPQPLYGSYVRIDINRFLDFKSLDYLTSIYAQYGKQVSSLTGGTNPSDEHIIHEIQRCYRPLEDKYKYDVTFISNGGYVDAITYPEAQGPILLTHRFIEEAQLSLVHTRRDCVAYLDIPFDLTIEDVPYYFEHISSSYAAAYDPWGYITLATGATKWMPPSFIQLYTHAKSIQKGNKVYAPPAGVRRGDVPEIVSLNHELSSQYLTEWQDNDTIQFINPILWINGYDYNVFGQKTLYNIVDSSRQKQSVLQNLHARILANEVKKAIFKSCLELTFELNNMMTWNEFKSRMDTYLKPINSEGAITDYEVLMGTETMTVNDLNSGHIAGKVRISIAHAVTDWDIDFEITPNSVTVFEQDYNSQYVESDYSSFGTTY